MRNSLCIVLSLFLFSISCIDDPAESSVPGEFQQEYQLIWDLFDENYVGFALKETNWNAIYSQYLHQVQEVDSREDMTAVTLQLLGNLRDLHTVLYAPDGTVYETYEEDVFVNCDSSVLMSYLDPWDFQWLQQDIWGYCFAGADSIPYFVVSSWSPSLNMSLLDNILLSLLDEPAMILDIRLADEGSHGTASNFSRRFVDEMRVGHMVQQRESTDSHELADPVPVTMIPRGWHYSGQVILLTGRGNRGVSEVFICNMSVLPRVVLMGDTTAGAGNWQFMTNQLPEGWYVTCPTATLLTADSSYIEGEGIPPEVEVQASPEDFMNGCDPVLENAFIYLGAAIPTAGK